MIAFAPQVPQVTAGEMAPFHEEQTLVFRGPLKLSYVYVYEPSDHTGRTPWVRTSFWNPRRSRNMTWMNNKGGGASGTFSLCGGNSQSFASRDGKDSAIKPTHFGGDLADGVEVNALSGQPCKKYGACGFVRGVSMHGWRGNARGQKMFVIKARMPLSKGANVPAIWMLNAQVVRSAQYGCNCRGRHMRLFASVTFTI